MKLTAFDLGADDYLIKPFALDRFSSFQQVNEMGATAASH